MITTIEDISLQRYPCMANFSFSIRFNQLFIVTLLRVYYPSAP